MGRQARGLVRASTCTEVPIRACTPPSQQSGILCRMWHPILFRVVLALALILNGTSSAASSVHMMGSAFHTQGASEAISVALANEDPAYAQHHIAAAKGHSQEVKSPQAPRHRGDHTASDCCKLSACRCACVQACASIPVVFALVPMDVVRDPVQRFLAVGRPSPALPHLIRPPIG